MSAITEIVTLANYKDFLKISADTYDTILATLKAEIEDKVRARLNRDIFGQTYTDEYYDGDGTNTLVLKQFPITEVSKIEEYWGLDANNEETWTELTQGIYYQRLLIVDKVKIVLDGYVFARGHQNYKITYTAGYDSTTLPKEIQKICKELMKLYWNETAYGENTLGKSGDSNGRSGGSDNITYDLTAEEKILKRLDAYASVDL